MFVDIQTYIIHLYGMYIYKKCNNINKQINNK